jgi:hypothetical protein
LKTQKSFTVSVEIIVPHSIVKEIIIGAASIDIDQTKEKASAWAPISGRLTPGLTWGSPPAIVI